MQQIAGGFGVSEPVTEVGNTGLTWERRLALWLGAWMQTKIADCKDVAVCEDGATRLRLLLRQLPYNANKFHALTTWRRPPFSGCRDQAHHAHLPPPARLLVTAKGHRSIKDVVSIDPHRACFEFRRH